MIGVFVVPLHPVRANECEHGQATDRATEVDEAICYRLSSFSDRSGDDGGARCRSQAHGDATQNSTDGRRTGGAPSERKQEK